MSSSDLTRRDFLQIGAAGLAAAATGSLIPNLAHAQTSKPLLQASDFTYIGKFGLPSTVNGYDTSWGNGLAHRYVNGQLRFFSTVYAPNVWWQVYEVAAPTPSASGPTASVVRFWGDIYKGKRYLDKFGGEGGTVYGLYWDNTDQRLYWSYGDNYNASNGTDCSLGYSTLNDSAGSSSGAGCWRFSSRGEKSCRGGVLPIPSWFANQYCSGRRLGVGFGGYFSAVGTGPASMGPALAAFSPPTSANADRSSLTSQALVGYPFNANAYTSPDRGRRDTDYTTSFDGWAPRNGVGYFTWNDTIWQSAAWIDLPDKHGLLYGAVLGNGRNWYETSTRWAERGSHAFYVYDPADLALVAQNSRSQDQIQWRNSWSVRFPGMGYPLQGWQDDPPSIITGMTFDQTTSRLYVSVRFAEVYVYQVSSSGGGSSNNAPPPPTNLRLLASE